MNLWLDNPGQQEREKARVRQPCVAAVFPPRVLKGALLEVAVGHAETFLIAQPWAAASSGQQTPG